MVTLPKLRRYRDGRKKDDRFVVVSDVYPTPTTDVADVVLPSAMWIEREGMFGNSERRTQHFEQMLTPPGEAMSDAWQIIEVARRMGFEKLFPWSEATHIPEIWKEYSRFQHGPDARDGALRGAEEAARRHVALREREGDQVAVQRRSTTPPPRARFDFYGKPDHRAWIWFRPYEAPPEVPDAQYPFWLNTGRVRGALALGLDDPAHSRAASGRARRVCRIASGRRAAARHRQRPDRVRLVTRRGSLVLPAQIDGRARPPEGQVFVPFFDEGLLINELTLDAFCPISKQPDYKKCAVRVERA